MGPHKDYAVALERTEQGHLCTGEWIQHQYLCWKLDGKGSTPMPVRATLHPEVAAWLLPTLTLGCIQCPSVLGRDCQ